MAGNPASTTAPSGITLDRALTRTLAEIHDGLQHGHFTYTLTCEVISREQRRFTLQAGKSYQFVIPKGECTGPTLSTPTPVTGATPQTDEPRRIVTPTSTRQAPFSANAEHELLVANANEV